MGYHLIVTLGYAKISCPWWPNAFSWSTFCTRQEQRSHFGTTYSLVCTKSPLVKAVSLPVLGGSLVSEPNCSTRATQNTAFGVDLSSYTK